MGLVLNRLFRKSVWNSFAPPHSVRRRLIAGMSGLITLRAAFSGISFASAILLARLLGPQELGEYSYSMAWIVLLAVPALLGMDQLLVREVAASVAKGDWAVVNGLRRWSARVVLRLSIAIAIVAGACIWVAAGPRNQETRITFIAALPFLPLISLTRVRQSMMQGLHRVSLGAMPEQLIQPGLFLLFLASAAFLDLHPGAPIAMVVNALAAAVAFAGGVALMRRSLPEGVVRSTPVYKSKEWFGFALPLVFVAGVAVVFGQADTLILGLFRDQAAIGIYSVAHKGSELISVVLTTQVSAFASTAANLFALRDMERLQRLVMKLARLTVSLSVPAMIAMIGFGHWYLLLFGHGFAAARPTLVILSIGQVANVATGCAGMLLAITGHEHRLARIIGWGAIANVTLSCALAPKWGAEGVAVAYAASMVLWNVWAAIDLYRLTGIDSTFTGWFCVAAKQRTASNAAA